MNPVTTDKKPQKIKANIMITRWHQEASHAKQFERYRLKCVGVGDTLEATLAPLNCAVF